MTCPPLSIYDNPLNTGCHALNQHSAPCEYPRRYPHFTCHNHAYRERHILDRIMDRAPLYPRRRSSKRPH